MTKAKQEPVLDFKELPEDGVRFEQLVRELLYGLGLQARWSGKGPDGGRDLICDETVTSYITPQRRTWLVQCKHKAHSGNSVGVGDLDNVLESCSQHQATGYLLVCSTQPSSALVARLEGITADRSNQITATFWDGVTIERLLSTPRLWAIAQRFMPKSSGKWRVYATESPSRFVAHYKGYVFQLTNRIGSKVDHHLPGIAARISEIQQLKLPKHHFIRPRAVWYDDKGGAYTWYIDYMLPHDEKPAASNAKLAHLLHDGCVMEDGQMYTWDIRRVRYWSSSDHYDEDHDDYYAAYLANFIEGSKRGEQNWDEYYATKQEVEALEEEGNRIRDVSFDAMVESIKKLPFVALMRASNARPEDVHRFERRFAWPDLAFELDIDIENLFMARLILRVTDDALWHKLLAQLPISIEAHFRPARAEIYTPSGRIHEGEEPIYDVTLSVLPILMTDRWVARKTFNDYFDAIRKAVEQFSSDLIKEAK
jgi:Restriction endonuclease